MKQNWNLQRWCQSLLIGLGLAATVSVGLAAPDLSLGTFDADLGNANNGPYTWAKGWGSSTVEWDATQDNTGNSGGSLYISGPFDRVTSDTPMMLYGITSGNPWWHPIAPFDMTVYKSLEFDIKWNADPTNMSLATFNAPPSPGGVQGLEIHACPDGAGGPVLAVTNIPDAAVSGWTHVIIPINPTMSGLNAVYGVWMNKWLQPGVPYSGTFGFWLDNVVLKGTDAPPPPPTVAMEAAVQGMNFIAASTGQYDRQEIRTVGSNYAWYAASGPVSYSMNVAKIGAAAPAASGFQLFMHLIPGVPDPARADSDWHEPNIVYWRIVNNADGSAWSDLQYKTNAPDSNGVMYDTSTNGTGFPGGVGSPTCAGTWTITFSQETNIVITAPGGGTVTNTLPPEVVDIFKNYSPNMQINIGAVPGELSRLGQKAIVTGAKFTGTPGEPTLDSNFVGAPRDTNLWSIVASSPAYGVQQIMPDAAFWLDWTLPASGFRPQAKATLAPGTWTSLNLGGYEAGGKHVCLVHKSDLPSSSSSFARLIKGAYSQLQVLLPGETAAPGTTTGKTGTPNPMAVFDVFSFTVNAVDSDWFPITGITNTVRLTTGDTGAFLNNQSPPVELPLANGTAAVGNNSFGTPSTGAGWTITAEDVTDPTKTSNTSGPVIVQ